VNAISHAPVLGALAKRVAGLEPQRPAPRFVRRRFTDADRGLSLSKPGAGSVSTSSTGGGNSGGGARDVVLFADTFGDNFQPSVLEAAVAVLTHAGYRVRTPRRRSCCGLTLISTGQLTAAAAMLKATVANLAEELADGERLVVLEPSCLAVFRSDGPELLEGDPNVALVKERAVTLAELLADTEGWKPPHVGGRALVQEHCHQHAVLGFEAERRILRDAGVEFEELDGCCGLAGNFGFEQGHLPVSVAVADHAMLPALRRASEGTRMIADGFSCRTQADQLGSGQRALHLAEVLASALPGGYRPRRTKRDRVPQRVQAEAMATLTGRKS
jgi:Fe-S oxidoreductase